MITQKIVADVSEILSRPGWIAAFATVLGATALARQIRIPERDRLCMDAITPKEDRAASAKTGPALTAKLAEDEFPTVREVNSIRELHILFRRLSRPENQHVVYRRFAAKSGVELSPQAMWLVQRLSEIVGATEADLAPALRLSQAQLAPALKALQDEGLVTVGGDSLGLTEKGRETVAKMVEARNAHLAELFSEWAPGGHYEIQKIIDRFTRRLNAKMPPEA